MKLTTEAGHSLDAYAFGMLVSDILDSGADLGKVQSLLAHLYSTVHFWYKLRLLFKISIAKIMKKKGGIFAVH